MQRQDRSRGARQDGGEPAPAGAEQPRSPCREPTSACESPAASANPRQPGGQTVAIRIDRPSKRGRDTSTRNPTRDTGTRGSVRWIPIKVGVRGTRACNNPLQRPGVPGSDRRERRGSRHVNGESGTSPSARPNPAGETPITAPGRISPRTIGGKAPRPSATRPRPANPHGAGQPDRYAYTECVNRWTPGGGGTASGHSRSEAASGARPRAAERFSVQRPRSGEPPRAGGDPSAIGPACRCSPRARGSNEPPGPAARPAQPPNARHPRAPADPIPPLRRRPAVRDPDVSAVGRRTHAEPGTPTRAKARRRSPARRRRCIPAGGGGKPSSAPVTTASRVNPDVRGEGPEHGSNDRRIAIVGFPAHAGIHHRSSAAVTGTAGPPPEPPVSRRREARAE